MAYRKPLPGGSTPHSNHGRAGSGLNSGAARTRFGDKAYVGAAGERHFATMLQRAALDDVCDIFYSLGLPRGASGGKHYNSDVDVALVNGNKIILVDVKRWKGGDFYWSLGGLPFRGLVPLQHGGKWKLSANMAAALRRYREALPGVNITAMVVFVPTDRGTLPASVRWLKWPGDIRSYMQGAAVTEIRRRMGSERIVPDARIIGTLKALER